MKLRNSSLIKLSGVLIFIVLSLGFVNLLFSADRDNTLNDSSTTPDNEYLRTISYDVTIVCDKMIRLTTVPVSQAMFDDSEHSFKLTYNTKGDLKINKIIFQIINDQIGTQKDTSAEDIRGTVEISQNRKLVKRYSFGIGDIFLNGKIIISNANYQKLVNTLLPQYILGLDF